MLRQETTYSRIFTSIVLMLFALLLSIFNTSGYELPSNYISSPTQTELVSQQSSTRRNYRSLRFKRAIHLTQKVIAKTSFFAFNIQLIRLYNQLIAVKNKAIESTESNIFINLLHFIQLQASTKNSDSFPQFI
ncbi:hypothetical protein [Chondrinema litorale]|uniref:hypothetical protein n=1 Tax=Chondrinema litorale TaxID=2994555 RepID=UPI0025438CB7|nr:hypothetical protein [Chondrinema litorale]UZR99427.1 hypothetical protein OQ292_36780 [Chondrinema litorale]